MGITRFACFVFLISVFSSCTQNSVQKNDGKNPNEQFFSIQLRNLKGQTISLRGCKKDTAAVFYFLAPECPLCQGYALKIMDMKNRYERKGFVFYTVWPGKLYTRTEIEQFLSTYKVDLPALLDPDFLLTNYFEASVTPEVFVTNKQGFLVYSGRIDDWAWDTGQKKLQVDHKDLEETLALITKGDTHLGKKTKAIGCLIEK
jgi:peroxiredoxin